MSMGKRDLVTMKITLAVGSFVRSMHLFICLPRGIQRFKTFHAHVAHFNQLDQIITKRDFSNGIILLLSFIYELYGYYGISLEVEVQMTLCGVGKARKNGNSVRNL